MRHLEDNVLRATTEFHLIVVMVLVLILKGGVTDTRDLGVDVYDEVATVLFVIFVPFTLMVCIGYKWRRLCRDARIDSCNPSRIERIKSAFKVLVAMQTREDRVSVRFLCCAAELSAYAQRHLLGEDKEHDRSILSAYVADIEADVNKSYHVLISYRVASEAGALLSCIGKHAAQQTRRLNPVRVTAWLGPTALARTLFDTLSATKLKNGQKLRVFLDQVDLQVGERWDSGFMGALGRSWIVVPLISTEALGNMKSLDSNNAKVDNLLLEWIVALELYQRGVLNSIVPIIVPSTGGAGFEWTLPDQLSDNVHRPTIAAAVSHLKEHPSSADLISSDLAMVEGVSAFASSVADDTDHIRLSASVIANAILRFQGVKMDDRANLEPAAREIIDKVARVLAGSDRAASEDLRASRESWFVYLFCGRCPPCLIQFVGADASMFLSPYLWRLETAGMLPTPRQPEMLGGEGSTYDDT
jgi:hypothetical protein